MHIHSHSRSEKKRRTNTTMSNRRFRFEQTKKKIRRKKNTNKRQNERKEYNFGVSNIFVCEHNQVKNFFIPLSLVFRSLVFAFLLCERWMGFCCIYASFYARSTYYASCVSLLVCVLYVGSDHTCVFVCFFCSVLMPLTVTVKYQENDQQHCKISKRSTSVLKFGMKCSNNDNASIQTKWYSK